MVQLDCFQGKIDIWLILAILCAWWVLVKVRNVPPHVSCTFLEWQLLNEN